MSERILITNARLVDPASGRDEPRRDRHRRRAHRHRRRRERRGRLRDFDATRTIDARGAVLAPGLVDLAARLGEPGHEHAGLLESELAAAVAGGVTSLVCPPDTDPVLDEPGLVEMLKFRARNLNLARLYPLGALTRGLAGEALTEMAELTEAGCIGFGQADVAIRDTLVLHRALQYAATFGYPVWLRPNDAWLGNGVAAKGPLATRLGLTGVPVLAETIALATIFELVRDTGARVHLCRLSSAAGVELVRRAKAERLPVTCDVSIHQLHLIDVDIGYFDAAMRLVPPLRQQRDRDAIRAGARRRHDRRAGERPHAGRRGRQAPAVRRSRSRRDRPRAAARRGAEVGRERQARPRAHARRGDQPAGGAARALAGARAASAARPGAKARSPTSACSIPTSLDGRPRDASEPQPPHAVRAPRDAGPRPLHARRRRRRLPGRG